MLGPRKDFIRAIPLNHAVVNLRVRSLVTHEVCEMVSTLHTWVPDNVLGAVARRGRFVFVGTGGSWFRHFLDSFRDSARSVHSS